MNREPVDEKVIFNTARKLESSEEVREYLDRACGDNGQARERIVELLRLHTQEKSFLEFPPPGIDVTLPATGIQEKPGSQIGPFKLMERIGEGGFGLVFVAQQQQPVRRKVALKIIKPGMDTKEVIARFEAERQALAMMDHPNIAKVLDGGTTDSGRPYFVMELVRGIPITTYCDRKRLDTRQRLKLFVGACQAIQHAHQKGVIHRDVKPSNVLVTEHDGTPMCKVIDFGVAKAIHQQLTERTIYTRHQQMVGTPLYMSPEQAELSALDVDTRTDVYSLGVLLYELLTGVTPLDARRLHNAAYDEMRRIIREEEPARPSLRISTLGDTATSISEHRDSEPRKLANVLRGELDWIVMKALEKDRTRRYETAFGLSLDVQRYLNQEAVQACPPSVRYYLRKLVRRHKFAVGFAASVITLLCAGIAGTSSGWMAAIDARNEERKGRNVAIVERSKAEHGRHVMQIRAADAHLELGNHFAAQDFLKDTLPEHRNWEWGYLALRAWTKSGTVRPSRQLDRPASTPVAEFWASAQPAPIVPFQPNGIWIEAVSLSHDGEQVATALGDGSVQTWNSRTAEKRWRSPPLGSLLGAVVFNHNSTLVACGSTTGDIWIWDLKTESKRFSAPGMNGSSVGKLWFSPDDRRLVVAYFDGYVGVWDIEKEALVTNFFRHSGHVWSVQFQTDDNNRVVVIASSVDGSVRGWDLETGEVILPAKSVPHRERLEIMAQTISPDLRTVVTGYHDGSVDIWDLHADQSKQLYKGSEKIEDLIFSQDGACVFAVEGQKQITVIDVSKGEVVSALRDPRTSLRYVAVSPHGDRIVTTGWDASCNIWAPVDRSHQSQRRLANAHDDVVLQAAYSPDGRQIVTASFDGMVRIWNALTQELIREFPQQEHELLKAEFDRSGRYVAAVSSRGDVCVWDATTGHEEFYHESQSPGFLDSAISDRALRANLLDFSAVIEASPFANNSDAMVVNGQEFMVVLDCRTGVQRVALKDSGSGSGGPTAAGWAVIDPSDKRVAVITDGRKPQGKGRMPSELHVWSMTTGERLFTLKGHRSHPFWAAFSPDGNRIVTGAMDGTAIIWDADTGNELQRLSDHGDAVVMARFSPDGERVVTAADDEVILWDATTGHRLASCSTPIRPISDIQFSPNGTRVLAVVSHANAAIVLDLTGEEGQELVRLTGDRRLLYATWSPNGRSILTTWDDGAVRLFEAIPWDDSDTPIAQRVRAWQSGDR